jgi:hypothetical protein
MADLGISEMENGSCAVILECCMVTELGRKKNVVKVIFV